MGRWKRDSAFEGIAIILVAISLTFFIRLHPPLDSKVPTVVKILAGFDMPTVCPFCWHIMSSSACMAQPQLLT
jgi:hypothetical protein